MRTLDDVKAWFTQPFIGSSETAGAPWWRLLPRYVPEAKIVVVRRPVGEVVNSLMKVGVAFDRELLERNMRWHDRKLGQLVKRVAGVLCVDYTDLNDESVCARVFEHCTGLPHDPAWWAFLSGMNLQTDMVEMVRYATAYEGSLNRLANSARQQILTDFAKRRPVSPDGMTFQAEPFEDWLEGAQDLFSAHCVTVGEEPDAWRRKNIPLMRHLDKVGAMQIMTARCNGRMFGYLMTILSPSLAYRDMLSGSNTTFYASPEFPGLGMKLQRAAIASLKDRGVGEMFFEAGKRGDGPRLSTMYRRLGAVPHGEVFRMSLVEA